MIARRLSFLENVSTLLALATIAVTGTAASRCHNDKDTQTLPAAGEIIVSVVERASATSAETDYKDIGGVLAATYSFDDKTNHMSSSQTRSFSGAISVPVGVKLEGGQTMSISKLEIADAQAKVLLSYASEQIEQLKTNAKNGVAVRLIVTKDGSAAIVVEVKANQSLPPGSTPDKSYKAIGDYFANPKDIITTADVEGTLKKLKQIASATKDYHEDILKLIKDADKIDLAHLNLLVDAAYFTVTDYKNLAKTYDELLKRNKDEDKKLVLAIAENMRLAQELSGYTQAIVNVGLPKATDLSFDGAMALLAKLYDGTGGASEAFATVVAKYLGTISAEQKVALLNLALSKGEQGQAAVVAVDWFKNNSDQTVATLVKLAGNFAYGGRDTVIAGGMELFKKLTAAQVVDLVNATYNTRLATALAGMAKVERISPENVVTIADTVSYGGKDQVVAQGLAQIPMLTTSQLMALSGAAYNTRQTLIIENMSKVSDLDVGNASKLATDYLSYGNKDTFMANFLATRSKITTSELMVVSNSVYNTRQSVILDNIDKLGDLNTPNVAKLANDYLSYGNKDTFIAKYLAKVTALSTGELTTLADAAYNSRQQMLFDQLAKVSDLGIAQIVTLAGRLSYGNRDTIILSSIDLIKTATVEDLVTLASNAYQQQGQIMLKGEKFVSRLSSGQLANMLDYSGSGRLDVSLKYVRRVTDLNAKNAASVAEHLSYGNKNTFVYEVIGLMPTLSVSDVITLAYASYDKSFDILTSFYAKLNDISVTTIVTLAEKLSYGNKDAMILTLMERLSRISVNDLITLANNAYQKQAAIIVKGDKWIASVSSDELVSMIRASNDRGAVAQQYLDKVTDLSAKTASKVADELSYGLKNTWIAGVMAKFPKFSTDDLIVFASATYQKYTETLLNSLDRLNDLGVDNTLKLAELMAYGNKNTVVQFYLNRATRISSAELLKLAGASYQQYAAICLANIGKISDLTVANAGMISDQLGYDARDPFLLAAVDVVTDLTAANLTELANHAYRQGRAVLEKGVKRLAGGH